MEPTINFDELMAAVEAAETSGGTEPGFTTAELCAHTGLNEKKARAFIRRGMDLGKLRLSSRTYINIQGVKRPATCWVVVP